MPWKPFPLRGITSIPPLLVSSTFTTSSYEIHITDLTYIWTESLSRNEILKRSSDHHTSIDPNEDEDQLQHLLAKLKLAIEGQNKTSLQLQAIPSEHEGGVKDLMLTITAELPAEFSDLVWPLTLKLNEQNQLTSQLTFPLLKAQQARLEELDGLIKILKDKDHVIQKLVDKIDAMGADLGHVFAGAMGKNGKKMGRKYAEDRVSGLKRFDSVLWKREVRGRRHPENEEVLGAVQAVFGGEEDKDRIDHGPSASLEKAFRWWNTAKNASRNESPTITIEEADEDDDAFQIQATPPLLPSINANVNAASDEEEEEEEEDDDLDAPSQLPISQRSLVPDSYPGLDSAHPSKRLGLIIGRKKYAPISPVTSPIPSQDIGSDNETTDDEDEVDDDLDAPSQKLPRLIQRSSSPVPMHINTPNQSQPPSTATTPRKNGLRKIGGKRGIGSSQTTQVSQRLSSIGRRSSTTIPSSSQQAEVETQEETASALEIPKPVLTAEEQAAKEKRDREEKADKRREELKRELDAKANAPVKKKRKF